LTAKPLIVKLTPNANDVVAVARTAQESGADALSLINTIRGMALDPRSGKPWLGGVTGGVSGPAVGAVALAQVYAVCAAVEVPVVGIGGIQSGADALAMLRAGATLVAVGTESFRDPAAGAKVAADLSLRLAHDDDLKSGVSIGRAPIDHKHASHD
jgi:dihydroorotate dehydrogenase (NAD+) catalytic subunit